MSKLAAHGKEVLQPADGDTARVIGAKGGRRRARFNTEDLTPIKQPKTATDVLSVLGQIMVETHGGRLEPKVANACAYLASGILQALSVGNFEERIAALEQRQAAMKGTR